VLKELAGQKNVGNLVSMVAHALTLGISFAVLANPASLYLLELRDQTAFFATPWGT
jgi:hypothetical protein